MAFRPGCGLPTRYIYVFGVVGTVLFISLLITPSTRDYVRPSSSSAVHPINWLPETISNKIGFSHGDTPEAFDENGMCQFMSPFDALSKAEKLKAEQLYLEEVSEGIVRSGHDSLVNPILGLLRNGERKWKDMLSTQSQTLEQAVDEYKTRYHRNPPRGFDLWWRFATERNVLLPDEYDGIHSALMPFWAFTPEELIKRNAEAEKVVETFTLIVTDGSIVLQWNDKYSKDKWWSSGPRADAQINLMESFMGMIPDFRATFTIHDQPSILPDHQRMSELIDLAKNKTHTETIDEPDVAEMNWINACPRDSPAGKHETETPSHDTFISSHSSAMDICQHPSILENHGITLEHKDADSQPKPHTRLLPIFAQSRSKLHADIAVTPVGKDGRHRHEIGFDPLWKKKSGKLYWRGLSTGIMHDKKKGAQWPNSHRERLHRLANDKTYKTHSVLLPVDSSGDARVEEIPSKLLSDYYMDVSLSQGPRQCDDGDGTCEEMKQAFTFAPKDPAERSNAFKYVFDIDGNSWSSRFPRLMASNNVVIKASIFPEWNTLTLPEWYAYVPAKLDYSDLYSIMAFFRGDTRGKGGHDEVARRIALNGQCWVERTWRREDMETYMFRLYLEWVRLLSPDRDTGIMDFILPARQARPVPGESKPLPFKDHAGSELAEADALPIG